jgi:hypothetical protein
MRRRTHLPETETVSEQGGCPTDMHAPRIRTLRGPRERVRGVPVAALVAFLLPLAGCLIVGTGCSRARVNSSYGLPAGKPGPYESLLQLVADLQAHLDEDIYRFGYPRDITGQNLFKASIVRLANYQNLYPGEFSDVVEMALAQCHERLGNYPEALKHYRTVAELTAGKLADLARERIAIAEEFDAIVNASVNRESISGYIADAESRLKRLDSLVEKYRGTGYESLARLEKERAGVEYAVMIKESRYALPDGTEKALLAFTRLIDEHGESNNISAHRLRLADFYFELASEYAALRDPERGEFDQQVFDQFLDRAIQGYYEVSQAEGYEEREEGRLKLQCALEVARTTREKSK